MYKIRGWLGPLTFDFAGEHGRIQVTAGEHVLLEGPSVTMPWDGTHPVTTPAAIKPGDTDDVS